MQKILVLSNYGATPLDYDRYFIDYAHDDQQVTIKRLTDFFIGWDGSRLLVATADGDKPDNYDAVHFTWWRTDEQMALTFGIYLEQAGIPFVGRTILDLYPSSKLGEMARLVPQGVTYAKSFYCSDSRSLVALYDWASLHGLTFPVVVKGVNSSLGNDNFLFATREELEAFEPDADQHYMVQEFIPNSSDYRLLIMGGEIREVIRRSRKDQNTHINNTAKGASTDFIDQSTIGDDVKALALRAAAALNRTDITGVDIVIHAETGVPYVLEVNRTPNIAKAANEANAAIKVGHLFDYIASMTRR